jgi:hypothetical protein
MLVISLAAIAIGIGGMRLLARRRGLQVEGSDMASFRI